ncbi:FxSxx-COOH system tetratricopeptide repeat protein [Actinoplanes sp. NPDC049596]|uniref:FxSxx-COOH system tetratricopeptide repeat protein n=1 Tax=unclassified Actinoplanes TaxID=2626549 RepID=UPI0034344FAC
MSYKVPEICNLPARNRQFSGRARALDGLTAALRAEPSPTSPVVVAVHGLGGVGKTQLALEYAHHHTADYDLIWWVPSDRPTSAVAAYAALAAKLGLTSKDETELTGHVFDHLRERDRWLLVLDDVEKPDRLGDLLPAGGGGHVLITSRWSHWRRHAVSVDLGVLPRAESVEMLHRRSGTATADRLGEIAALLGDLPLALEEAAAFLEESQLDAGDYISLVRDSMWDLFGRGEWDADVDTQHRLATVWTVSLDRVRTEAPAAHRVLSLLAFLAPHVSRTLLHEQAAALPAPLASAVRDRLNYESTLAAAGRYSLVSLTADEVSMHPLVQLVVRTGMAHEASLSTAAAAVDLVRAAFPADVEDEACWPDCARLLPHVLAVTEHAERLEIAGEPASWLLGRVSAYLRERAQHRQASPLAARAVAMASADPELARHHHELGQVRHELGDLDGAREQYEQALRIGRAALGPEHVEVGVWHNNLGNVLHDLHDLTGAREQYELALRVGEVSLGPQHPIVALRHGSVGMVLRDLGDLDGAREQMEEALRISEAALGAGHPTAALRRGNLGMVLRDLGDLDGARQQMAEALRISEAALGARHPAVGNCRANLAMVLRDLGDFKGARQQLEEALEAGEQADPLTVGIWHNNLGNVLQSLGDLPAARASGERALDIAEAALGATHPTVARLRNNLVSVLRAQGDLNSVRKLLEPLVEDQPRSQP